MGQPVPQPGDFDFPHGLTQSEGVQHNGGVLHQYSAHASFFNGRSFSDPCFFDPVTEMHYDCVANNDMQLEAAIQDVLDTQDLYSLPIGTYM